MARTLKKDDRIFAMKEDSTVLHRLLLTKIQKVVALPSFLSPVYMHKGMFLYK